MALVEILDFRRFAFRLFRLCCSIDIGAGHAGPRFSLCKIRAGLYPQVTEFVSKTNSGGRFARSLALQLGVLALDVGQGL